MDRKTNERSLKHAVSDNDSGSDSDDDDDVVVHDETPRKFKERPGTVAAKKRAAIAAAAAKAVTDTFENQRKAAQRKETQRQEAQRRESRMNGDKFVVMMLIAVCGHLAAARFVFNLHFTSHLLVPLKDGLGEVFSSNSWYVGDILVLVISFLIKWLSPWSTGTYYLFGPVVGGYILRWLTSLSVDSGIQGLICGVERWSPNWFSLGLLLVVKIGIWSAFNYYSSHVSPLKKNSKLAVIAVWTFVFWLPVLHRILRPPAIHEYYCPEIVVEEVSKQMNENPTLTVCPDTPDLELSNLTESSQHANATFWDATQNATRLSPKCIPVKKYKIVTDSLRNEAFLCNSILFADVVSSRFAPSPDISDAKGAGASFKAYGAKVYDYVTLGVYVPYCMMLNVRWLAGNPTFLRGLVPNWSLELAASRIARIASRFYLYPIKSFDNVYSEDSATLSRVFQPVKNILSRVFQPVGNALSRAFHSVKQYFTEKKESWIFSFIGSCIANGF
jgi:hypothetical protein